MANGERRPTPAPRPAPVSPRRSPYAVRPSPVPSPVLIERPFDRPVRGKREHVIDVLPSPGDRVGIVLKAAFAPLRLFRHRIDGDPAKKLLLLVDLSYQRDPFDEGFQVRRIPF